MNMNKVIIALALLIGIIFGFLPNLVEIPESIQILIVSGISLTIGIFVGKLDEEEKNKRENVNEFKENEY